MIFSLFLLLFVYRVFINIHAVIRIYVCCNNLYAYFSLQESIVRCSANQTIDGNLRERAPGLESSAFP